MKTVYFDCAMGAAGNMIAAALLTHFANRFARLLPLIPERIGYGMGTKDFHAANCLRVFWGEAAS